MIKRRNWIRGAATLGMAAAIIPTAGWAQGRTARIVVPYPPGGGVDAAARTVSDAISEALGMPVIVENRPGAGGNIAMEQVARAPADGTTFIMTAAGPGAINVSLYPALKFDPEKDFEPVVRVASTVFIVCVPAASPAQTLQQLLAQAKARPGTLSFASVGTGATSHLAVELLKAQAGVNMVHIPYKGTGPAMTDLIGGHVSMMFVDAIAGAPHLKSGKLRGLAVTSERRLPELPELPTVSEAGVPGFAAVGWSGLLAPRGTPEAIVRRVNEAVARILPRPEVAAKLGGNGSEFGKNTPAEFAAFLRADIARWKKAIEVSGTKLD
ncbi:tripartite tricarboxylate transporter substrate binding protein [Ramlibacter tataouinensis]|uniref:Bug family tripartite tricarboxylate transporter substrate binding protein n=1 Tax=Ramlibacter tataouinensis TaxID=94132 RepID=UPI0022F382B0|nr:tripartite tricarboxylate transporter substrate binding protein [Ramlibacter tataouinensis]WBY03148.1 tripartite tricarboxylate transporter substrate binding protein [Ramlibacter tataouinensis]